MQSSDADSASHSRRYRSFQQRSCCESGNAFQFLQTVEVRASKRKSAMNENRWNNSEVESDCALEGCDDGDVGCDASCSTLLREDAEVVDI